RAVAAAHCGLDEVSPGEGAHQQVVLERARGGRHRLLVLAEAELQHAAGVADPGQLPALALGPGRGGYRAGPRPGLAFAPAPRHHDEVPEAAVRVPGGLDRFPLGETRLGLVE